MGCCVQDRQLRYVLLTARHPLRADETGLAPGHAHWVNTPASMSDPSATATSPTIGRAFTILNAVQYNKWCVVSELVGNQLVVSDYALLEIEMRTDGGDLSCYPEWTDGMGQPQRPASTTIWCMHGAETRTPPMGWYDCVRVVNCCAGRCCAATPLTSSPPLSFPCDWQVPLLHSNRGDLCWVDRLGRSQLRGRAHE